MTQPWVAAHFVCNRERVRISSQHVIINLFSDTCVYHQVGFDLLSNLLLLNRSGGARKLNPNAAHSLCMPMSSKNRSFVEGFSHR
jgi:hypothetical protein